MGQFDFGSVEVFDLAFRRVMDGLNVLDHAE